MAEKKESLDLQRLWIGLWLFRRRLVYAVALGVIGLALLFFGAYRFWNQVSVVRSDIRRERTGLERSQQRASLITSITPELRAQYELASKALPLYKDPLLVLRTVEAVARDTGVQLSEYEFSPGVVSTGSAVLAAPQGRRRGSDQATQKLSLKFDLTGTFSAVTNAVAAFESSLPLMEITDMSINPTRSTVAAVGPNEYVATLQLDAFYATVDAKAASQQGAARLSAEQQAVLTRLTGMKYRANEAVLPAQTATGTGRLRGSDLFGIGE